MKTFVILLLLSISVSAGSRDRREREYPCAYAIRLHADARCTLVTDTAIANRNITAMQALLKTHGISGAVTDSVFRYKEFFLVHYHGQSYLQGRCTVAYRDSCHQFFMSRGQFINPDPCTPADCDNYALLTGDGRLYDASHPALVTVSEMDRVRASLRRRRRLLKRTLYGLAAAVPVAVVTVLVVR